MDESTSSNSSPPSTSAAPIAESTNTEPEQTAEIKGGGVAEGSGGGVAANTEPEQTVSKQPEVEEAETKGGGTGVADEGSGEGVSAAGESNGDVLRPGSEETQTSTAEVNSA